MRVRACGRTLDRPELARVARRRLALSPLVGLCQALESLGSHGAMGCTLVLTINDTHW